MGGGGERTREFQIHPLGQDLEAIYNLDLKIFLRPVDRGGQGRTREFQIYPRGKKLTVHCTGEKT